MSEFKAPKMSQDSAAKLRERPPYVLHSAYYDYPEKGTPAYWEVHRRTPDGFEPVVNQLNLTPLRFDSREAAQAVLETLTIDKILNKVFG